MIPEIKKLLSLHKSKRKEIKQRLADFNRMRKANARKVFAELCFCLCTPQSKAVKSDKAVRRLEDTKALFKSSDKDVAKYLKGFVRFHNKKARFIVKARKLFCKNGSFNIKGRLVSFHGAKDTRHWLVKNIKGLGLKEASHFLRNIGLGRDLAIIDRHILTNLKIYGAIKEIPQHISDRHYLLLEERMRQFSKKIGIPLAELDLLFWSNQTGYIFK